MYVSSVAEWIARGAMVFNMDGVGRLWLTIVANCNDSPWMELVDYREKFSLFANSRSLIRVVRKGSLLAQPQSALTFEMFAIGSDLSAQRYSNRNAMLLQHDV